MDRNIEYDELRKTQDGSPPARVAWIETDKSLLPFKKLDVATREGGVDRNLILSH